jgi:hypothetical protein
MSPRDFLDEADDLAAGTRESSWRTGASRAYYAAFHTARQLLLSCGFVVPQSDRAHAYLSFRLQNSGHPDVNMAGRLLRDLRGLRLWADYELGRPLPQIEAFNASALGADIVRVLEEVPTVPGLQGRITQAIRDYERDVLKDVTWRP